MNDLKIVEELKSILDEYPDLEPDITLILNSADEYPEIFEQMSLLVDIKLRIDEVQRKEDALNNLMIIEEMVKKDTLPISGLLSALPLLLFIDFASGMGSL